MLELHPKAFLMFFWHACRASWLLLVGRWHYLSSFLHETSLTSLTPLTLLTPLIPQPNSL